MTLMSHCLTDPTQMSPSDVRERIQYAQTVVMDTQTLKYYIKV